MRRIVVLAAILAACAHPKPAAQNPSPMVDTTRAHERLRKQDVAGRRFAIDDLLAKPVEVLDLSGGSPEPDLLVHLHGASWVAFQAAAATRRPLVIAVVNLGAGSGVYERAFADPATLDRIAARAGARSRRRYLSAFSAGYGAVRAILRGGGAVDGVLLLDGLHASYVDGKVATVDMAPFVRFAQRAAAGERAFVITHSEIFPGTYASTTETTDHLLAALGMRRTPVMQWGPGGMQQLSEAGQGRLTVLGFAGNSAPDHVDHLHGMATFLERLFASAPESAQNIWQP